MRSSQLLRPSGLELLYLTVVVVLAMVACDFIGTWYWAFLVLALFTVPLSVPAFVITWWGGIVLFGPEEWGIGARLLTFVLWVGVGVVNVALARAISAGRRGPTSSTGNALG